MNPCPGLADWEAFVRGDCAPPAAAEHEEHLRTCDACRKLVEQVRRNNDWLNRMRGLWTEPDPALADAAIPVGQRVGRYTITGLLGSGGMATVYSAEQENPRRAVALKVLRSGLASRASLRRLEREAELLGRLQHPGIAQIYEAGHADFQGLRQPFFAMELVAGERLLEFADRRKLGTRERLELVTKVAEAVHFAHEKGIIHRDLKPGNILVIDAQFSTGGAAQPKILDFGVARCTDSDLQATTLHTDVGQLVGTIPYMSPEQAAGDPGEIDVRCDVYALGVITYELLTARLPYDVRHKGVAAAVRIIREEEPTPLSQTNKLLRGDIETIVAKALEKEKDRRYASAADFASDLRRWLNDEPIAARPPSATYQLAKFAKRNKALVTGVAGVFVALCAGLIGTGWGLLRATAERNRAIEAGNVAEARRTEAETVTELMVEMLSSADPERVKGADYTVRELLDDFATGLDGRFPGQPEVEATIRSAIGNAYRGLGLRPEAETHLLSALKLRRRTLGDEHLDVARSLNDYGWRLHDDARYTEAEWAFREALQTQRKLVGEEHAAVAASLNGLSDMLRHKGEYETAEPLAREALAMRRRLLGPDHRDVAESLANLGRLLRDQRKCEEAESAVREALTIWRARLGEEHRVIAGSLHDLGLTLFCKNDLAGAEAAYQESLTIGRKVLGDKHHDVAMTMGDYMGLLSDNERYDEALPLIQEAVAIQRNVHGEMHSCLAWNVNRLCVLLFRMERHDEAEPVCRETLRMYTTLDQEPWMIQLVRVNLALTLIPQGKTQEAIELTGEALKQYRKLGGDDHLMTAAAKRALGTALVQHGQPAAAEPLLRESVETYVARPNLAAWRLAVSKSALGDCLAALGRFDEAEPLLAESCTILQKSKGMVYAGTRECLGSLIRLYEKSGRAEKAALYREMLAAQASPATAATAGNQ